MASKQTPLKLIDCKIELEDCMMDSSHMTDSDDEDDDMDDMDCCNASVSWELIGEDEDQVLVNDLGYTYKQVRSKEGIIDWRCTVRSKTIKCHAGAMQREDRFVATEIPHCHAPLEGGVPQVRARHTKRQEKIAQLNALDDEILSLEDHKDDDSDFKSDVKIKRETTRQSDKHHVRRRNSEAAKHYSDLKWELVENGTNRGNPQLYNSMGYSYTLSNRRSRDPNEQDRRYWRCSIRNRSIWCSSSVIQKGDNFTCFGPLHNHKPKPEGAYHSKVRALVRDEAINDPSRPSTVIVDIALSKAPKSSVPPPPRSLLIKEASRWRCKLTGITPKPNFGTKGRLESVAAQYAHLKWEIVSGASNRGADYLINNEGYTFTKRKLHRNGTMIDWRCTVRTKTNACKATVTQKGNLFAPNDQPHSHSPRPHSKEKAQLKAELRKQLQLGAVVNSSAPTSKVIETAIQKVGVNPEVIGKRDNIIRLVNKKRRDAKEKVLLDRMPDEHSYTMDKQNYSLDEHSYTTEEHSYTTDLSSAPLVQVVEPDSSEYSKVLDIATGGEVGMDYEDNGDDNDQGNIFIGNELLGELQQAEDGTIFIYEHNPAPPSTSDSTENIKLKARIKELESELQSYKSRVERLQKTANRPMVIKLDKGTVQTVACDHQTELKQLRIFRDAANVSRSQLTKENTELKREMAELKEQYQSLSQQMSLKEAEWCKKEAESEASMYQNSNNTVVVQAQRLTSEGGTTQIFQVPDALIHGSEHPQHTIEVPGDLIHTTAEEETYVGCVVTTIA